MFFTSENGRILLGILNCPYCVLSCQHPEYLSTVSYEFHLTCFRDRSLIVRFFQTINRVVSARVVAACATAVVMFGMLFCISPMSGEASLVTGQKLSCEIAGAIIEAFGSECEISKSASGAADGAVHPLQTTPSKSDFMTRISEMGFPGEPSGTSSSSAYSAVSGTSHAMSLTSYAHSADEQLVSWMIPEMRMNFSPPIGGEAFEPPRS